MMYVLIYLYFTFSDLCTNLEPQKSVMCELKLCFINFYLKRVLKFVVMILATYIFGGKIFYSILQQD